MEQVWTFFAFPLNLLLAVIWMAGWGWMWKNHRDSVAMRFLLSPKATISSILLLLASCLWIGLSGDREFVVSYVFVALLLYLQTVLFVVILRGWRRSDSGIRWRFLLIHAGLLLAVGAGFWGSPDSSELRVGLRPGEMTREAYRLDGGKSVLAYELHLYDCTTTFNSEGQPDYYEAVIGVGNSEQICVTVNHPYNVRLGEDIYITSVSENGCVLQIVREPWRYFALVGIIMMLIGAFMLFIKGPQR